MSRVSDAQGQDWDDIAAEGLDVPTASSRRLLLSGAAGGLVLAASGLFLPEWLQETEAREGALGGAKGGRRGKDHKGRHKKRTHGDKKGKHKDRKPGDIVPTHPAIVVENGRSVAVQTRGLQKDSPDDTWHVPSGWDWAAIEGKFADDVYPSRELPGDHEVVVVQIGTDRVVRFDFLWPFDPYVQIYSGGWEWDGWRPQGEILVASTTLAIGDSASTPGITATRIQDDYSPNDNNNHVWLRVRLT